ncbi:MAG: response regulator [Desulfovibrionaceae bacterium]|nr:response regulator [Desulfovibrionaceae bacterium]
MTQSQAQPRHAQAQPSILVVDDEQGLLDVCEEALNDRGFEVFRAANGEEALSVLGRARVDVVLSDLKMPLMGGMDMLRRINELGLGVDVIFLTGYGTIENAVACMRMGAREYLLKPFDLDQLFAKIDDCLKERRLRSERSGPDGMPSILELNSALRRHDDQQAMLRELLVHVKKTFAPEAMALFLPNGRGRSLEARLLWGEILKSGPRACAWLLSMAERCFVLGRPKMVDHLPPDIRGRAQGPAGSAMIAPLVAGGGRKSGVVAVIRADGRPYTAHELQLLDVFASQAAPSVETVKARSRIQAINLEIITSYARAVEAKDIYTRGHSERVSAYAALLGRGLNLERRDVESLRIAGVLHDIGKIGIPDRILNKPSALTDKEFEIMKTHPVVGRDILSRVTTLRDVLPLVYHHHERYDGRGYPDGLRAGDIPLLARALSVVDGYEALTSDRSYHQGVDPDMAVNMLLEGAGSQWDPDLVRAWLGLVRSGEAARAASSEARAG